MDEWEDWGENYWNYRHKHGKGVVYGDGNKSWAWAGERESPRVLQSLVELDKGDASSLDEAKAALESFVKGGND